MLPAALPCPCFWFHAINAPHSRDIVCPGLYWPLGIYCDYWFYQFSLMQHFVHEQNRGRWPKRMILHWLARSVNIPNTKWLEQIRNRQMRWVRRRWIAGWEHRKWRRSWENRRNKNVQIGKCKYSVREIIYSRKPVKRWNCTRTRVRQHTLPHHDINGNIRQIVYQVKLELLNSDELSPGHVVNGHRPPPFPSLTPPSGICYRNVVEIM